ncbi:MAG TPA: ATP synthase subunit I [Steroidobacteraceae bacterium]
MAIVIDLPAARRLAFKVVLGQAGVTLVAALVGWLAAGRVAALSALLGGGIATVASFAMVAVAFRPSAAVSPARLLGTFFGGEVLKLVVVVALFVAVLHWLHPAPLALLVTYAATFVVYWLALGLALPSRMSVPPLRGAQG